MKSRAFVRNMIFQSVKRGESLILTDPKSELYEDMSVYLKEQATSSGFLIWYSRSIATVGTASMRFHTIR